MTHQPGVYVPLRALFLVISIFKEDNVFSMTANLPYCPPMNTDIDYIRLFLAFF